MSIQMIVRVLNYHSLVKGRKPSQIIDVLKDLGLYDDMIKEVKETEEGKLDVIKKHLLKAAPIITKGPKIYEWR